MMHRFNLLIIIPARKKSKQIINKNIRLISNHPLFVCSIEASKEVDKKKIIHLLTDFQKILKLIKNIRIHLIIHNENNYLNPNLQNFLHFSQC